MTDDELILVCMPVAAMLHPIAGARSVPCADCRDLVWIAPSSVTVMDRATAICMGCAIARFRKSDDGLDVAILPGAIDELRRHQP